MMITNHNPAFESTVSILWILRNRDRNVCVSKVTLQLHASHLLNEIQHLILSNFGSSTSHFSLHVMCIL